MPAAICRGGVLEADRWFRIGGLRASESTKCGLELLRYPGGGRSYWPTPNGQKVSIFLEESAIGSFPSISAAARMPAIVDTEPAGGSMRCARLA
jgi:hypothetical protein